MAKTKPRRYWVGEAPVRCDACSGPIIDEFSDASNGGIWGCFCPRCVVKYRLSFGLGRGQQYTKQSDDKWLKTKG